jgi:hypothetical protein
MINLILGILTGVTAAILFLKGTTQAWYVWVFFVLGAASIILSFDVLSGSIKEHENRAAILGFLLFSIPGFILVVTSLLLGI